MLASSLQTDRHLLSSKEQLVQPPAARGCVCNFMLNFTLSCCRWEFLGLVPLFDPPRHDTKETIER